MVRYLLLIGLTTQISGCIIGNGTICGPQTPVILCDKKAFQKLYNPTPLRDYWVSDGSHAKDLSKDWIECGGTSNGSYVDVEIIPNESNTSLSKRMEQRFADIQRCMLRKKYDYTGPCDLPAWKVAPACQERSSG